MFNWNQLRVDVRGSDELMKQTSLALTRRTNTLGDSRANTVDTTCQTKRMTKKVPVDAYLQDLPSGV
jgi:hypothetical protein